MEPKIYRDLPALGSPIRYQMSPLVKMIQFGTVPFHGDTETVLTQYDSGEPLPELIRSKWKRTALISCKRSLNIYLVFNPILHEPKIFGEHGGLYLPPVTFEFLIYKFIGTYPALGSPIRYQMGQLVKVIQFGTVPFHGDTETVLTQYD